MSTFQSSRKVHSKTIVIKGEFRVKMITMMISIIMILLLLLLQLLIIIIIILSTDIGALSYYRQKPTKVQALLYQKFCRVEAPNFLLPTGAKNGASTFILFFDNR